MASVVIDQIKDRVDIVDLVSGYLKLQKSGVNYKARCPFHNEKSASFFVSPERQIWHCFGCSLGGDIFSFIKQIEGVEFPEALRILATRAGIDLYMRNHGGEEWGLENAEYQSEKTKLLDICELATRFFEKQLWQSNSGKAVLAYLRERGLTDDSIRQFRLGWSPDIWTAIYDFLSKKYDDKAIFDAGLIIKKEHGGYYDRFRSRIIFPIFDLNGQAVGFTGRVFGELAKQADIGKYVNSPQTQIYDKSRILYGLHAAKLDIRRANRCLVVEGNMDVIMSHQAGVKYAVASSGTALTDGHLKIIKRYTDNLDLCFDADTAGSIATDRGVDLALARGFNVGIVTIPESQKEASTEFQNSGSSGPSMVTGLLKDPADYVKIYGAKWAEVSQNSRPFMDFYFDTAKKAFDISTALGKKLFSQKLMPFLASMANKIEQSHWVSEIALALKTKEETIYEEITKVRPKEIGETADTQNEITEARDENRRPEDFQLNPHEESLLSLLVKKPELAAKISPEFSDFLSDKFKNLLVGFNNLSSTTYNLEPALAVVHLKSQELWKNFQDRELEEEFNKLLSQIRKRAVSARLASLEYDIKSAEREQNKEKLSALLAEFAKVSKQLS